MNIELTKVNVKIAALLLLLFFGFCATTNSQEISVSAQEAVWIAERVFENECSSKDEYIVQWNEGEEFLSLGIGHFIWYPKDLNGPFEESFLKYLNFAKASGEKIPNWLSTVPFPPCPWNSREDFLDNQGDDRLLELKEFLIATKSLQAIFIVKRLESALPQMLNKAPINNHKEIIKQFYRLASTPEGIYALVDYINFKGLGILESEQYQGEGWGLLQVLSEMQGEDSGMEAVEEFSVAAKKVLTRRVANSPKERNEEKWMPGWQRRIDSYCK